VQRRNEQVKESKRCQPEAGQRQPQRRLAHKLTGRVELRLEGRAIVMERQQAAFGTTGVDPRALTVRDALAALSRPCSGGIFAEHRESKSVEA
jgi:hypothetical protein